MYPFDIVEKNFRKIIFLTTSMLKKPYQAAVSDISTCGLVSWIQISPPIMQDLHFKISPDVLQSQNMCIHHIIIHQGPENLNMNVHSNQSIKIVLASYRLPSRRYSGAT